MRILLIYPPIEAEVPAKSTLLGLGYVASALRDGGHEVKIQDAVKRYRLLDTIGFQPDVVCISAMFTDYKQGTYDVIANVRRHLPEARIIVGGAHASLFPKEMSRLADTVIVGEGEPVINEVIKDKKVGIIYSPRVYDIDKFLMPAWDLMINDIEQINEGSREQPFIMRRPFVHILTSRGCPNECTFCAVKTIWGRAWSKRSAKSVVDEIQYLKNKYGFREFHINDDNCSIDRNRMYELCNRIIASDLDIKIATPTGIQIKNLDEDLLRHMKQAGFYRLCFGIETGNQEMQHKIKKNIDLEKAKQVIRDANDLGFWTAATFILGFPSETHLQRLETLRFAEESGLDFPIFYSLNPQPKTEVYEKGMTEKTDYNELISEFYQNFIRYKLFHWLTYINLMRKVNNWEDFKYLVGLIKVPLKMLFRGRLHNEGIRGR